MKAFVKLKYGGPEVLELAEVEKPLVKEDEVLLKVMANSPNPADWHILRGKPFFARFSFGLFKPKNKILGADFAGIVEEVGENVTRFKKGDKVFGESLYGGAFAAYTAVLEKVCALMPNEVSFKEMACVPLAGLTALQAIVTQGQLQKGETVLINGGSGGVGHFAVQIAKNLGAKVTAVCSAKNVNFVKSIGADHLIAYDKEHIHQHQLQYDLVVDTHGNLNHSDYKRMGQRGVVVGFTTLGHMFSLLLRSTVSKFPLKSFTASPNVKDLETLAAMVKNGKLKTHIEQTYSYERIPEAIAYIEQMRTKGKVAIVWDDEGVGID